MRAPELIAFVSFLVTIGFVIWTLANTWRRRLRLRLTTEFNTKLLDRIGSVKDFNDFLQTEGGAKFMESLAVERSTSRPQDGILRASQIGIVLMSLGFGVLGLGWYFTARYAGSGDFEVLTVIGAIALSLGLGFLISAGASYRLARMLGVLDRNGRRSEERHPTAV
jgi:hypothetical protein